MMEPTETRLRLRPCSWGEFFRYLGVSAGVGGLVGVVLWFGSPHGPLWSNVLIAAYIGLWIYLAATLLSMVADPGLRGWSGGRRVLALAFLMFLAGALGWLLAYSTLPLLSWGRWRISTYDWRIALSFAGTIGLLTGLAVYSYAMLRQRLETSLRQVKEYEVAQRQLEDARALQTRLLPPRSLSGPGYCLTARNVAAELVAGDFYDVFPWPDGGLGLAVGDVAGKGMSASLIMATVKARLPLLASEGVARTLERLNETLRRELRQREFVALCLVCFDPATGKAELANAGMPDPYLFSRKGPRRSVVVSGPRLPLGLRAGVGYEATTVELAPGDQFLLFSDGLPETEAERDEVLGYEAFERLLPDQPVPRSWIDDLFARLETIGGPSPTDDRTALLLERVARSSTAPEILRE